MSEEEERLTSRIIELAKDYGRYGYRMITGLLRNEGWKVNHKRVERIWRQEGLKMPKKQPKRDEISELASIVWNVPMREAPDMALTGHAGEACGKWPFKSI